VSYLGLPRLHFAGRFQADPSTVNNDPSNYVEAADDPEALSSAGGWNPNGTGAWRLAGCRVTSVVHADGTWCDDPHSDAAIGLKVANGERRVEAKIVDLDPDQQGVSELWGFEVVLGDPTASGFASVFATASFSDIWVRCPSASGDACFGAVFQSVLSEVVWADALESTTLQQLAQAAGGSGRLSIRLSTDGFDPKPDSPSFTFGRLVGAIGPAADDEPSHFVAGRRLRRAGRGPLSPATCVVSGERVTLDLANSFPAVSPGGKPQDVGPVWLALVPAGSTPQLIAPIPYLAPGWYEQRSGIETIARAPEEAERAASTPLGLVGGKRGEHHVLLAENAEGAYVRADRIVFRLDPDTSSTTTLTATRFGVPAAGQRIDLRIDNSQVESPPTPGKPKPPRAGVPHGAVEFDRTVTIGGDGRAIVTVHGRDPGNPRGEIDGQVYGVRYDWHGLSHAEYEPEAANILAVRVFDAYPSTRAPTWVDDVEPIFRQYARMYPVMRRVLDLGDYTSVVVNRGALRLVFGLPLEHPNSMPVTRDLSGQKRAMIVDWLRHLTYMRIDDVGDLRRALQTALELEHSTIPPYLCALFSLKPGSNYWPAAVIRSIVREEMLHMALVCNLLNAVGGTPRIDQPSFVPTYPGPLPGGLRPYLTVHLRKASIEQIRDVFMGIEEPERTLEPAERHRLTIGWFYRQIAKAFEDLDDDGALFSGDRARQVEEWHGKGSLFAVHNLETAKRAIAEIVEQGEGASPHDPEAGGEIAHYYRFEEIVRGRRMVAHDGTFSFSGDPIPFDQEGVFPMRDDPNTKTLPPGSAARHSSQRFDDIYGNLLTALQRVFDGHPQELGDAIGLMYALQVSGRGLMEVPTAPGSDTTAGPSFRYPHPTPEPAPAPPHGPRRKGRS
jgi:hypothetical protein